MYRRDTFYKAGKGQKRNLKKGKNGPKFSFFVPYLQPKKDIKQ